MSNISISRSHYPVPTTYYDSLTRIYSKIISGAVSETDCEDYVTNILPGLIQNYSDQDIFNFDELGLFF